MNKKWFRFMFSVYLVVFILLLVCICRNDCNLKLSRLRNEYVGRTSKLIFDEYVRTPIQETTYSIIDNKIAIEKNKVRTSQLDLGQEEKSYNDYLDLYNYSYEEANDHRNIIGDMFTPLELIEILLGIRGEQSHRDALGKSDYSEFFDTTYYFITDGEGELIDVFDRKNFDKNYQFQIILPFELRSYRNDGSLKDKILEVYKANPKIIYDIIGEQQRILDKKILNILVNNYIKPLFYTILVYYIIQGIFLLRFVNFILNGGKTNNEHKKNNGKK